MSEPAICVERLSRVFGGLRAVDEASLSVASGERRVLIGPNGAGKTTLFNCIAGTLHATAGRVLLFGRDISALAENKRTALGMGRTFQISNVFTDLTVFENLMLSIIGTSRRKWIMHRPVASFVGEHAQVLDGLARVGLSDRAGEPVKFLSYGERRQLELALALNVNPRVLLLDEPCAGLAASERRRFSQLIAALPRAITLIMIEHDIDVALALADRVTVLHHGKVILDGTPAEVQTNALVREVYFGRA